MAQIIRLGGIEAEGRHGVGEDERRAPQRIVVDVEMSVEARSDDLDATADYDGVVEAVRAVVTGESHRLIETLAGRLAEAVAGTPGVRSCCVTVHKPEAAARLRVADVSAEARSPEGAG